jgi:hypothetical protein
MVASQSLPNKDRSCGQSVSSCFILLHIIICAHHWHFARAFGSRVCGGSLEDYFLCGCLFSCLCGVLRASTWHGELVIGIDLSKLDAIV